MKIYIASSWKNQHAVELLTAHLRTNGHEVKSFVEHEGKNGDFARLSFNEWVDSEDGRDCFEYDTSGATDSELVIYIGRAESMPGPRLARLGREASTSLDYAPNDWDLVSELPRPDGLAHGVGADGCGCQGPRRRHRLTRNEQATHAARDCGKKDMPSDKYITVVYKIEDEAELAKSNPMNWAHYGCRSVGASLGDALTRLEQLDEEPSTRSESKLPPAIENGGEVTPYGYASMKAAPTSA